MDHLNLAYIDAFTTVPFTGNPAAVTLLTSDLSDASMQKVAMEANLSETSFLRRLKTGRYHLRWFTPRGEVDLCGHATLAAAHWLWESGVESEHTITFEYVRGELKCERNDDQKITMHFPSEPPQEKKELQQILTNITGQKLLFAGKNRLDYLVECESVAALIAMRPNLNQLIEQDCRGLIATAKSSGEYDFQCRTFYPRHGIPEDPVTGSAFCCLGPFWAKKLANKNLHGYQASARGGSIAVSVDDHTVKLTGSAVTTAKVEMICPQ